MSTETSTSQQKSDEATPQDAIELNRRDLLLTGSSLAAAGPAGSRGRADRTGSAGASPTGSATDTGAGAGPAGSERAAEHPHHHGRRHRPD